MNAGEREDGDEITRGIMKGRKEGFSPLLFILKYLQ
jgi:hypothetical protein